MYFLASGNYTIQTLGMTANQISLYNASNSELISSASGNGYLLNSLVVVNVSNLQEYKLVVSNNCNTSNLTSGIVINQKRNIKIVITPSETDENNQSAIRRRRLTKFCIQDRNIYWSIRYIILICLIIVLQ